MPFLPGQVQKDGEANVGLMGQRFALDWVQKYIHLFPGSPGYVCLLTDRGVRKNQLECTFPVQDGTFMQYRNSYLSCAQLRTRNIRCTVPRAWGSLCCQVTGFGYFPTVGWCLVSDLTRQSCSVSHRHLNCVLRHAPTPTQASCAPLIISNYSLLTSP